jgi:hypothetical protein
MREAEVAAKTCHGCGSAVRSGAKFCAHCGRHRPAATMTGDRLLLLLLVLVAILTLFVARQISVI